MNDSNLEEKILEYLTGTLPPEEEKALAARIRRDENARALYTRICRLESGLPDLLREEKSFARPNATWRAPARSTARRSGRSGSRALFRIAAALLLVGTLTATILLLSLNRTENATAATPDPVPSENDMRPEVLIPPKRVADLIPTKPAPAPDVTEMKAPPTRTLADDMPDLPDPVVPETRALPIPKSPEIPEPPKRIRSIKKSATIAGSARIAKIKGTTTLHSGGNHLPAKPDQWLSPEDEIVVDPGGRVEIELADGTRITAEEGTRFGRFGNSGAANLHLSGGSLQIAAGAPSKNGPLVVSSIRGEMASFDACCSLSLEDSILRVRVEKGSVRLSTDDPLRNLVVPAKRNGAVAQDNVPFFFLGGRADEKELKQAAAAADLERIAHAARAVATLNTKAAADDLAEAVLIAGKVYDQELAQYVQNRKVIQTMQGGTDTDLGRAKDSSDFDQLLLKSYHHAEQLIRAEKCALETAKACVALTKDEAVTQFIKLMKKNANTTFGDYLAEALGYINHPDIVPALVQYLNSRGSWKVKVACLDALGMKASEKTAALGAVQSYLGDEDIRIRKAALAAQQTLTGQKAEGGAISSGGSRATFYEMRVDSNAVIFIVDASASMSKDDRFGKMKQELRNVIQGFPEKATVNIVHFNCLVYFMTPGMIELSKRTRPPIDKYIEEMEMRYVTNTFETFQTVFRIVRGEMSGRGVSTGKETHVADTIFFLTDGKPTVPSKIRDEGTNRRFMDPELIIEWVKFWNRRTRLTINTIGIGEGGGSFLQRLAEQNGGKYTASKK